MYPTQGDKDWLVRRTHKINKQELLNLQATLKKELEVPYQILRLPFALRQR